MLLIPPDSIFHKNVYSRKSNCITGGAFGFTELNRSSSSSSSPNNVETAGFTELGTGVWNHKTPLSVIIQTSFSKITSSPTS